MANNSCVIWQANIARLVHRGAGTAVAEVRASSGGGGVGVDNEGAGDIDLDASRADDGVVNLLGGSHGAWPALGRRLQVVVDDSSIVVLIVVIIVMTVRVLVAGRGRHVDRPGSPRWRSGDFVLVRGRISTREY